VYNPLDYAWESHRQYLEKFGKGPKKTLWLGIIPGPFGMAQTGVPFGEVDLVKNYLGIDARVKKPQREHPKRPIEGFDCKRSEVSGARLWGWVKERYPNPHDFFEHTFVVNWCPLVFMTESGGNVTPDKIPAALRNELFEICDRALVRIAEELKVEWIVGVGAFATERAKEAWQEKGTQSETKENNECKKMQFGTILHPSPASPAANRGWSKQAEKQLKALGIDY
jgi:single-strand selective monofunctional uracil DNA glycosylase